MKKRLMCLCLALIMVLSLCMTACSTETESEEGKTEEVQRKNMVLTIYAITDEKTTEEGLKAVEEKISNYCVAKYKTAIDLRFFTESEYQAGLNAMYDKFAAEEAAKKKAEEEALAKQKSEAAYKATLTADERTKYEQEQRRLAKEAEEAAKKKAEEEAELIAQGKDVATVKEVQMDIIYIPGMEEYYSYIDQGLLVDINSLLTGKFKRINDYVFPSFLTGATVGTGVYGVPNNCGISSNATYLLVNTALANKYNVDLTKVRSITDLNDVYALVKANEAGVAPISGDFAPEGLQFYEGVDMAHAVGVFSDTLLGGKYTATNTYATINPESSQGDAFVKWCETKAAYRKAGYLSDAADNFFVSVKELSLEEKAQWEGRGYTPVLYKGAKFDTRQALDVGLFGISKYCQDSERAMEILQLISTDTEFRNLFAFGIEGENYVVRADAENENVITIIDDSYSMDFFKTGNALIGYIPDTMDPHYIEKAKEANLNSSMDFFLGFRYNWNNEKEEKWLNLFKEWKEYLDPLYQQLSYGTDDYMAILTEAYDQIYKNPDKRFSDTYPNWQTGCGFRNSYKSYTSQLTKLSSILHFENVEATPSTEAAAN